MSTEPKNPQIEWQIRSRAHYEWRKCTEAEAAAMYRVNKLHVRAVVEIPGLVPRDAWTLPSRDELDQVKMRLLGPKDMTKQYPDRLPTGATYKCMLNKVSRIHYVCNCDQWRGTFGLLREAENEWLKHAPTGSAADAIRGKHRRHDEREDQRHFDLGGADS